MNNEICCLRGQADESETENIRFRHKQEPSNQINPELALRQSEEKFRLAFHTSPDSINFNRLSDGMYIDINEGFTKLTGYTREDAIGKSSVDLNIWYDPKDRQRLVKALQSEGYVENLEARFRRKNGLIGVGLMSARVLRLNQEDVILSITRDITERKQVEDALRESENKYSQLVESLTDAILVWSGEHIIYANPTALKLFRANQAGDLIGKRYLDFVHPDDRLESVERIKKSKNEKWIAPHREHRMITADGQVIHVESTGVPIQCQGQIQHFGIFSDITERKKIEEELRENLLFLRQTERIAQIGGWKANIKTDELMWTEGVHQITETPLDYKPGLEEGLRFYDPESIPVIKNALTRALKNGSPFAIQAKVNTRTGKQLWAEVRGLQQVVEGEKTSVVGTFQDITERRQAEEALRKSEEQYRAIFENAIEGFFQSTPEGRFIRVNKALAKMCGYASPEEMVSTIGDIGEQHYESKKDREIFLALLNEKGVVENFEHQTFRKDGSTFWVSVSARAVKDNDNRILYYEGSHVDIDERKRADKRLIDAKEQYRSLFDTSTNAILIRNRAGIITMVNKAAITLLQAEKQEELIGRSYLELVHPEDRSLSDERVERIFQLAVEQRKPRKLEEDIIRPREHRMITLHGDTIDVESTGIAYQYKGEFCIQGIFRDITARKLAEEHLRETEKQYRELAESLPQVIFEIDLNGNLKYLNQIGFQLFGYTPEEISKGFNVLEAFIPENRERLALDIMLNVQGQMFGRKDYTALRKDGTKFPAGVHASRVMSGQTATGVKRNPH